MPKLFSCKRKRRKQETIKYALAPTSAFVALPNSPLSVLIQTPVVPIVEPSNGGVSLPEELLQITGQEAGMPSTAGMPSAGISPGANPPSFFQLTMSSNLPSDKAPPSASPCCVRSQSPKLINNTSPQGKSEPIYSTIIKNQIGSTQGISGSDYIDRPLPDPPDLTHKGYSRVAGLNNTEQEAEHFSDANQNVTTSREPAAAAVPFVHQYSYALKPHVSGSHESRRKGRSPKKVTKQKMASVLGEKEGCMRMELSLRARSPKYVTAERDGSCESRRKSHSPKKVAKQKMASVLGEKQGSMRMELSLRARSPHYVTAERDGSRESQRKGRLHKKVAKQQMASVIGEKESCRNMELSPRARSPRYVTTERDGLSLSREAARGKVKRKKILSGEGSRRVLHVKSKKSQRVHSHKKQGWPTEYRDISKTRHRVKEYHSPGDSPGEDAYTTGGFSDEEEVDTSSHPAKEYGYHSGLTPQTSATPKFENRDKRSSSTRRKKTHARTPQRSASVPSSWDGIPVIQSCDIQHANPATVSGDIFVFSETQPDGTLQYYASSPVRSSARCNRDPCRLLLSSDSLTQSPVSPANIPTSSPRTTIKLPVAGHHSGDTVTKATSDLTLSLHKPQNTLLNKHVHLGSTTSQSPRTVRSTTQLGSHSHDYDSPGVVSRLMKETSSYSEPCSCWDKQGWRSYATAGSRVDVDSTVRAYTTDRKQKDEKKKLVQELVNLLVAEKKALRKERESTRIREDRLGQLKKQRAVLQKNNQRLVEEKIEFEIDKEKLTKSEERAKSLVGENTALQKKLEALGRDGDRQRKAHLSTISRLTDELQMMSHEHSEMEVEMRHLKESHDLLHHQFGTLKAAMMKQVPLEEHKHAMENMQCLIEDLDEKNKETIQSKDTRIRVLAKQNDALMSKSTDARALIDKLKEDNKRMHKLIKKAERKSREVHYELELCKDKEAVIHKQLSKVVAQAEKTMADKTILERTAEAQKLSTERAIVSKAENEIALINMEKKVDAYERETSLALDKASKILRRNEKDHQHQRERYLGEIRHLRNVLNQRQEQLEQLSHEKR